MVNWTDVLGLTSLLVGIILVTIAIPTQEWSTYGGNTLGLWRICPSQGGCTDVGDTTEIEVVRSMVLLGDIVALMGVIVMLVAFVLEASRDISSRWTKLIAAGVSLLAGAFILAGVVVYTIEVHDDLQTSFDEDKGYSFWLAITALIIMFISAFIFIVGTVMEERKRRKLSRKTKELRERSREENGFRKNGFPGRSRADVPRPYSENNHHNKHNNNYQNGHLPKTDHPNGYRRRHRSASPVRRDDFNNVVWDRYQHQYVPRLVPVSTVLPETQYFDPRLGLPLGTYQHVDPVGPKGFVTYVGGRPTGGHRRSPSGGYPGVHSLSDWRRQGHMQYSDPYLYQYHKY
ncbi:hypothetical protein PoB_007638900 [Plakobranchus ocellatus]|uniref:Uncharacterized protein n=1 Tax=Plakobranchus ocellatus TaxID=259542 RepID=A0AAV4E066_9GAST|nr:hypothetical protein PoB_007638900 [Plakobranchus ocellatus]